MATPLSIQLYTLRDQIAADRDGTLTRLAEIGYRSVETYDPTADPAGFRKLADDLGISVSSTHAYALFSKDAGEVFDAVATVGTDLAIIPGGIDHDEFTTTDGLRRTADLLNGFAAKAAERGIRIGYHNHWWEIEPRFDGRTGLEVLAGLLAPEVFLEVDTYWAQVGGADVPAAAARAGRPGAGPARQGRPGRQGRAAHRGRQGRHRRAVDPGGRPGRAADRRTRLLRHRHLRGRRREPRLPDRAGGAFMTGGSGGGPVGVALVGAGVISTQYLTALSAFPDVAVLAVADLDTERARAQAEAYQVPVSGDVASVLAIPEVEIVVNLTIPAAHAEVASAALRAGKHVYGEKPLALAPADGAKILAEARSRGLRVGSAPDTFLGAGLQSAARAVRAGLIGEPVGVTAVTQGPGPESWHPSPEFLFQYGAGPLFDIGPYYLTALVALFGPVARVSATARQARAERVIGSGPKAGTAFAVEVPTHVNALLDFASGPSASATFSFDSARPRRMIEITGTEGTLSLPDPNTFEGPLRVQAFGEERLAGPAGDRHDRGARHRRARHGPRPAQRRRAPRLGRTRPARP